MAGQKNDTLSYTTSQLFNFARDSYLERTSRPIYAIVFLLPFIIFYEIGTLLINTDVLNRTQVRVVAFVWLQEMLQYLGTGDKFAWIAPPVVVVIILLGLQIASRKPWWFCPVDYLPMVLESAALAVPLIVMSLFFNSPAVAPRSASGLPHVPGVVQPCAVPVDAAATLHGYSRLSTQPAPAAVAGRALLANIVTGVGAGIYEELVFRLILICALMVLFQDIIGFDHKNAIILSVLISAALFSAHHHHIIFINGHFGRGAPFSWTEFVFRTVAGVYFAGLFAARGFGITAGAHAFYDIIATIINILFFGP
jgi:hypothetical protein